MIKLFALAVFILVVLGGIIVSFASRKPPASEIQASHAASVKTPRPKAKTVAPLVTLQTNNWQTATVSAVTIKAPKDWSVNRVPSQPNEKLIEVKPSNRTSNELIPRLFIRTQSRQTTSAELEAVRLRGVGFQDSGELTIAGQKAQSYTMLLPGDTFTKGNPKKQDVMQIVYLFEKDKSVYQVDIAYYSDSQKDRMLKTLSTIGASIILQ